MNLVDLERGVSRATKCVPEVSIHLAHHYSPRDSQMQIPHERCQHPSISKRPGKVQEPGITLKLRIRSLSGIPHFQSFQKLGASVPNVRTLEKLQRNERRMRRVWLGDVMESGITLKLLT